MPTALITGILGQDGSLLAELLVERGYRVVGVVRPGRQPPPALQRCELVEVDLAQPSDTQWATQLVAEVGPDEVYHLAACHRSSEPGLRDDPAQQQTMVAVNVTAALALAHAVLARGRGSLVLAASSQMYAPALPPRRIDEVTEPEPPTFYGVTKAATLAAVSWLRDRQGLRGSCAILFNHESPRRPPVFSSRKITRAAARIAAGLETSLELADVYSQVDFCAAADVVEALHAMGTAAEPADRVIASGQLRSLAEVCEVAFSAVGLDWQKHVRSVQPPGTRASLFGDPSKAERELAWRRKRGFVTWIEEMVDADRRALATHGPRVING